MSVRNRSNLIPSYSLLNSPTHKPLSVYTTGQWGVGWEGVGRQNSPQSSPRSYTFTNLPSFRNREYFSHWPAHVSLMVSQRRSLQYLEWRPSEVNIGYIAPRARHDKDCTSPDPQTRSWWRGEDFRTWKLIHFFIYLILENSNANKE